MKIEKTGDKHYRLVVDGMGNSICGIVQMANDTWAISDLNETITVSRRFKSPDQALKHLKGQKYDK